METYAYVFSSDEGEEQQRNIKFISKEPEITPDGKKGYCLTLDAVPLVFSAVYTMVMDIWGTNGNEYFIENKPIPLVETSPNSPQYAIET